MTDDEIERAAMSDPDAQPMTLETFEQMERVWRDWVVREAERCIRKYAGRQHPEVERFKMFIRVGFRLGWEARARLMRTFENNV